MLFPIREPYDIRLTCMMWPRGGEVDNIDPLALIYQEKKGQGIPLKQLDRAGWSTLSTRCREDDESKPQSQHRSRMQQLWLLHLTCNRCNCNVELVTMITGFEEHTG